MTGAMEGVRVVELCDEMGMFAGKLLADMGAEVVKVEPPGGDRTRTYPPFADDQPGPERSLYFWHYNTSKASVTLDLQADTDRKRLRSLIDRADILLQSGEAGADLDYESLRESNAGLIMVTLSPFGRGMPREDEAATDLTILAGGGPVWNCGYDDHSLPPVRGGGNQGYHTASHFGVMSALVALLHRDETGRGQHIDVNAHAAANVTTEAGTYTWLVAQDTVQRQTGRHAGLNPSMPSQVLCKDGRYVNTGIPPRRPESFAAVCEWLTTLGLVEEFLEFPLLEEGKRRERFDMSMLAAGRRADGDLRGGAFGHELPGVEADGLRVLHGGAGAGVPDRDHLLARGGAAGSALRRARVPRGGGPPRAGPHRDVSRGAVPVPGFAVAHPAAGAAAGRGQRAGVRGPGGRLAAAGD